MSEKRNTHQQSAIFEAVNDLKGTHPTADGVYRYVRLTLPTIGRATVYRVLNQLTEQSRIRRVHIPTAADIYDSRIDAHYHMRCGGCGRIIDIEPPSERDPFEGLSQDGGCRITGYEVTFFGFCSCCHDRQVTGSLPITNKDTEDEDYGKLEGHKNGS